jgi:hypothetical protein
MFFKWFPFCSPSIILFITQLFKLLNLGKIIILFRKSEWIAGCFREFKVILRRGRSESVKKRKVESQSLSSGLLLFLRRLFFFCFPTSYSLGSSRFCPTYVLDLRPIVHSRNSVPNPDSSHFKPLNNPNLFISLHSIKHNKRFQILAICSL